MRTSPSPQRARVPNELVQDSKWLPFCLTILLLKLALLMVDPQPRLFLGDSGSYIWTALTGWIPDDRSYFLGYVIRWLCLSTASLTPLLLFQALLSAATAIIAALISSRLMPGRLWLSYLVGLLCAIDPMQLVWERYVMAEAISLFLYALLLYCSVVYLRRRPLFYLCAAHLFGVLVIGFRMSYLPVTQLSAPVLPLLAFLPDIVNAARRGIARSQRIKVLRAVGLHLLVSCTAFWMLHLGYKQLNGWMSQREPDYLYATGFHLLASWAPVLEPSDAADERLARIIEQGEQYGIKSLDGRNAQRFAPDHLVDLWQKAEPDPRRGNDLAKQTALNALKHHPDKVFGLGARTFAQYFDFRILRENSLLDLGHNNMEPGQLTLFAEKFHFAPDPQIVGAKLGILQRYFRAVWPYYYVALLSPGLAVLAIFIGREKRAAFLILAHSGPTLALSVLVSGGPTMRYLQPISFMTIIVGAICVDGILSRKRKEPAEVLAIEKQSADDESALPKERNPMHSRPPII